jgi:hypothetical protein
MYHLYERWLEFLSTLILLISFILYQDLDFIILIYQIDPNKTDTRTVKSLWQENEELRCILKLISVAQSIFRLWLIILYTHE